MLVTVFDVVVANTRLAESVTATVVKAAKSISAMFNRPVPPTFKVVVAAATKSM